MTCVALVDKDLDSRWRLAQSALVIEFDERCRVCLCGNERERGRNRNFTSSLPEAARGSCELIGTSRRGLAQGRAKLAIPPRGAEGASCYAGVPLSHRRR